MEKHDFRLFLGHCGKDARFVKAVFDKFHFVERNAELLQASVSVAEKHVVQGVVQITRCRKHRIARSQKPEQHQRQRVCAVGYERRNDGGFGVKNVGKNFGEIVAADVVVAVTRRAVEMSGLNTVLLKCRKHFQLIFETDFVRANKSFRAILFAFFDEIETFLTYIHIISPKNDRLFQRFSPRRQAKTRRRFCIF